MPKETGTRDELLRAGIIELREYGLSDFSIRRVATACGISCAAPYRHFVNKDDFILSIFRYINRQWYMTQNMILSEYENERERLIEMSVAYIRFLLENPDYYLILMLRGDSLNPKQRHEKAGISVCVKGLISRYCHDVGMNDDDRIRKTYIVRSMIFGAAAMLQSGELENSENVFDMIRSSINREFEIN